MMKKRCTAAESEAARRRGADSSTVSSRQPDSTSSLFNSSPRRFASLSSSLCFCILFLLTSVAASAASSSSSEAAEQVDQRQLQQQQKQDVDLIADLRAFANIMAMRDDETIEGDSGSRRVQEDGSDPFDACPSQLENAQECFVRAGKANARQCRICIDDKFKDKEMSAASVVIPGSPYTCAEVASGEVCLAARNCPDCGLCYDETADLLACGGTCEPLNCANFAPPDSTPESPTPSPTGAAEAAAEAADCDEVKQDMDQCFSVDNTADLTECGNCVFGFFPQGEVGCGGAQRVCRLFNNCPSCGQCALLFHQSFTCGLGCSAVDCDADNNVPTPVRPTAPRPPTAAAEPTKSPRPTIDVAKTPEEVAARCTGGEEEALNSCLADVPNGQTYCLSCVERYVDGFMSRLLYVFSLALRPQDERMTQNH